MKTNRRQWLLIFVVLLIVVVNIFPVFWMISSAFKTPAELFTSEIRLIPNQPTWENFRVALFDYDFPVWFVNSIGTTLGLSVFQIITSVMAAFALCYFHTRYNVAAFYFIIATMVIPFQVTMIPNYILVSKLHWMNRWESVIVPGIANATCFFFLYQHVRGIPRTYYEVATIEGAGSIWTMWNVVVGLCKGAISAMFILCIIDSWNQYFWPLLVLSKPESRTLTIGLQQFLDHEAGNRWGPFMATATLASLPIIVIYMAIQKNIIDAFITSGIKG